MHLKSPKILALSLSCLMVGVLLGVLALPVWRALIVSKYQDQYGRLTYLCDSAMRTHYLAKANTAASPSADSVQKLERAELALINCQDYDILQKKLLMIGLRENELGLMRLKAIEADANGLRDVVDAHEIRD